MQDSSKVLRVGLIGLGKMGQHHLKAIGATGMAKVVGVADPMANPDDMSGLVSPDAIVVGSAAEMLEKARPDVVHIVTPPALHADMALLAIRARCHIYVEKPFTPTRAEAERVLSAAAEQGVTVCAGHQVLFEAPSLGARKALPAIGQLSHIESYFAFKTVRRTITPVDQLNDILPHAVYPVVDQLRLGTGITNAPIAVEGMSVDATGEAYVLLRLGAARAVVMVTLNGRPVEQYQSIIGTNGSLRADYIGGFLGELIGPGTGPGVLLTPFRRSLHTFTGTTRGVTKLVLGGSYPGLRTLVRTFYENIRDGKPSPVSPQSILDTVGICETVGEALAQAEAQQEATAKERLAQAESSLPRSSGRRVLLTGGTGLLGRRIAEELRAAGTGVRVVARRMPPYSRRVPGVEYVRADLAQGVDPHLLDGVTSVVHAAAETAGGKSEHRRNSIDATRRLIEAAARAKVPEFIHISSLAVLKTSREMGGPLDESTPVDPQSLRRGPYVWGKAESETLVRQLAAELNIAVKVIRPGPLVDYTAYQPPGRLGRELGPVFAAIGPKRGDLNVCDVTTAAKVVRSYVDDFAAAPPLLNLVEAPPPTRRDLMERYRKGRPDLRVFWIPAWLLRAISAPMRVAQRVLMGAKEPVDIAAAFAGERYRTALAAEVIQRADRPARPSAA